jgi:hypothetical protein
MRYTLEATATNDIIKGFSQTLRALTAAEINAVSGGFTPLPTSILLPQAPTPFVNVFKKYTIG